MYNADYQRLLFIRLLPEGVLKKGTTTVVPFLICLNKNML